MNKTYHLRAPRLLICFISLLISNTAIPAGLNSETEAQYLNMSNYTKPGTYESASRGSISAGSYVSRHEIGSVNVVTATPWSAKGSCGGIDMYGGGFSFINAEELITLFKQTAQNSKGYAFQLAMDNICPTCIKWINELQTKMQKLVNQLSDSCQLAQGVSNTVFDKVGIFSEHQQGGNLASLKTGISSDWAEVTAAASSWRDLKDNHKDEHEKYYGNILWEAFKKTNAKATFLNGSDDEMLETIMSMTGTIVLTDNQATGDGNSETPVEDIFEPLPDLSLESIALGSDNNKIRIYDCSPYTIPNKCTTKLTKEVDFTSLNTRILDSLRGNGGLLEKYRTKDISALPDDKKNVIRAMPSVSAALLFRLINSSPDLADPYIEKAAKVMAIHWSWKLVSSSITAMDITLNGLPDELKSFREPQRKKMKDSLEKYRNEFQDLSAVHGNIESLAYTFNNLIKLGESKDYSGTGT